MRITCQSLKTIESCINEKDFSIDDFADMQNEGVFSPSRFEEENYKKELMRLERTAMIISFSNDSKISVPKVELAYKYAYREGHSLGYEGVFTILYDVLHLYLDMNNA